MKFTNLLYIKFWVLEYFRAPIARIEKNNELMLAAYKSDTSATVYIATISGMYATHISVCCCPEISYECAE